MKNCIGRTVWQALNFFWPSCPMMSDTRAAAEFLDDRNYGGFTIKHQAHWPNGIEFIDVTAGDSKDLWKAFQYARIHWGGGVGLIFGPGRIHSLRFDGRHTSVLQKKRAVYILYDDGQGTPKTIPQSSPEFPAYLARAKTEYHSEQAQEPEKPIISVDDVSGGLDRIERLGIIAAVIVVGVLGWSVLSKVPKTKT